MSVDIDIIPGSAQNAVNLSGAGVIPVAILSSPTFDALQVDPATITLAGANVRMIGASNRFLCQARDVNKDGLTDLVCDVQTAQFLIQPGDSTATLEGATFGGTPIIGHDAIHIVP